MSTPTPYPNQFLPDSEFELSSEDLEDIGLPLEEIKAWCAEDPTEWPEDLLSHGVSAKEVLETAEISPSEFTEFAFRMPRQDMNGYAPFSFEGRRHMRSIYDSPSRRILLIAGRQVEKSTLLGNMILCRTCLIPSYRFIYVSPSATQTKVFSMDRIKEPVETSPILKTYTTRMLSQNIMDKQFVNRSKITLRYAFLNADRVRGNPGNGLAIDEIQDILVDNIPVIEQCLSHSPDQLQKYIYSGTPKSLDNTIEKYWAEHSTQNQWVVPCTCVSGEGGRYWNILGERNIGKKGLICDRCGKRISAAHEEAQWAWMQKYDPEKVPFEGFRIHQLMVPWKPWEEVLLQYNQYSRARFYNEVLGISFDSGTRPLTQAQIRVCCRDDIRMNIQQLEEERRRSTDNAVYGGIDWGSGDRAFTVLTLGRYEGMRLRVFYVHRFVGEEAEPETLIKKLIAICKAYHVKVLGCDHGFGFGMNDRLIRVFGPQRVQLFQYAAKAAKKVEWSGKLRRWKVYRTEVMSDVFSAIRRGVFQFPRWEEFKDPYAQDMLNIFSEENERLGMLQYGHHDGRPDDSFHSLVYMTLASCLVVPRPDIFRPMQEAPNVGLSYGSTWTPVNQG